MKRGRVGFYLAALRWLWANRTWEPSRQKFKALDKWLRKGWR